MFLIRTASAEQAKNFENQKITQFYTKTWEFWYVSGTKNVPYQSRSYNPKVQIFSIYNNWVIQVLKLTLLFLLGTLFLIRTASEKIFLIRTIYVKYIENKIFLVNELFYV